MPQLDTNIWRKCKWGIALSYPSERGLKWGIVLLVGKQKPQRPVDNILHSVKKSSVNVACLGHRMTGLWELGKHD
jgi:hypothetical protein